MSTSRKGIHEIDGVAACMQLHHPALAGMLRRTNRYAPRRALPGNILGWMLRRDVDLRQNESFAQPHCEKVQNGCTNGGTQGQMSSCRPGKSAKPEILSVFSCCNAA
jgi:hypothetical protein